VRWNAGTAGAPDHDFAVTTVHLAVLDDETEITELLANYLTGHGFRVSQLHSGAALMELMASDAPALVLLDLGLPGEEIDKVVGLEIGADDYVTKPFDLRELLARIKAVLRRLAPPDTAAEPAPSERTRLRFADWELDTAARRLVDPQARPVALTTGEFDLLAVFALHPGRVLSRDFLLEATRGREAAPFDRTIDVQVGRLRKKLEADPEDPQIIKSVRGAGYILVPPVTAG
jgi:DNA-binding response OmpR family regulator